MAEEEQMGTLVLLLGDFHVPMRAAQIPGKYREMITPNKVNGVLCTGNMGCREVHDWVKNLTGTPHIVKGDYEDEQFSDLPEEKVVEIAGLKIGLIHGHQVIPWGDIEMLDNKASEMGVQILVTGHTHTMSHLNHNHKHFINPGSMTGAFSTLNTNSIPSFIILEIKQKEVTVYEYSLVDDELTCNDSHFDRQ